MYLQLCLTQGYPREGRAILAFAAAGQPSAPRPVPQGGAAGSAPTLALRGEQGPLAGRQVPVAASPFTVGRGPDCNLVLSESQASRRHARLELREGRWWLQDLDSANGTFVNRQRLIPAQPVPLSSGDVIAIGGSVFTALLQAPARPVAAPAAGAQVTARPRRASPIAAIAVGVALVAVIAAVVWALLRQVDKKEEVTPTGPTLPTIVLPEITIPTVQLPAVTLPAVTIPTVLPISTPGTDIIAPLQTALPGLKLPSGLPTP